jgi:hypothetical protein
MKKLVCFLSIAVIMLVSVVTVFAHSGRTDSKGGHTNRSTGEYHYHHGYGAHQHDDGFCPIEPKNERYYSDWYKFKILLSEIPKETLQIAPIIINALLVPLFLFIIKTKRNKLFPFLSFEERDRIDTIRIHYFRDFTETDFFSNSLCILLTYFSFLASSLIANNANKVLLIILWALFTVYYICRIIKEYKISHTILNTIRYNKTTITHMFDKIKPEDYITVNPSDCYLPQHFQIKIIVFTFYILSLILFFIRLIVS